MRAAAARMSTSYECCLRAIAMLAVQSVARAAAGAGSAIVTHYTYKYKHC